MLVFRSNNHVYLKHQDINQLCETYSNKIESTTAATNQLMTVLLASLQHPQPQQHNQNAAQSNASTTQILGTQSSPSTKSAKRMSRIQELEGFICTLKENSDLRGIRKLFKIWKMKYLAQMNECYLLMLFQLFVLFSMIAH